MLKRLLPVLLLLMLLAGCSPPGSSELVFIEKDAGKSAEVETAEQPLAPVVKDQVQLTESNLPQIKVCVLPFLNRSAEENLDYYTTALSQIFSDNLYRLSRFSESVIMDQEEYGRILEKLGYESLVSPDQQIAAYLHQDREVEYIVHGEIRMENDNPVIQPYVIDIRQGLSEYNEMQMEPMTLRLNNFLDIDPFVRNLIERIDEMNES